MEKVKTVSDLFATWVTILGVFIAGIFAGYQYLEKAHAVRVKETLKYVAAFDHGDILRAKSIIDLYWRGKSDEMDSKKASGDKVLYAYINSAFTTGNLHSPISTIVVFFENLQVCICSSLCDEATAKAFLGKEAYDRYGQAYPYLAEQRKELHDPSFGRALERFQRSYRSDGACGPEYCEG